MNIRKILISLVIVLAFSATAAWADPPGGMFPPHGFHPLMGPAGITADKQNLYILAGPKIMQYNLADLKLVKTADLPKPMPPQGKEGIPCPPPPPHMAGPHGVWAGDGFLYVLAGPMLFQYSIPDLTLKKTVELPKPEFPKAGK
ncbi:MAG: hypothetical protein ACYDIC_11620 [Desulfobaccales bacterium]